MYLFLANLVAQWSKISKNHTKMFNFSRFFRILSVLCWEKRPHEENKVAFEFRESNYPTKHHFRNSSS